ncbi:MAG TPA: alpha/beta fold hydrolase [Stellaceae bacterium]|nr:alpha/beta fold hydrolase [Stellaceae bacterium]
MPAQRDELKVRGVTVALQRAGRGRTVLFLHGAGGVPQWLPFFDTLAEHFEVLVPEHPGFGGSDDPPWITSMSDLALFYLDLVEETGLDRVHLIGNSLGGWLAAEILVRDRSRFSSLVQLAPAGIRVKGVPCGDNFIWGPEEAVRNLYHDQSFADRLLAQPPTEAQLDVMLRNRFTVAKLGWQPRWFSPDLEKWLHRIKLPSLVVWGDDDKIMPPQFAALWRERLPEARLVMVERCGHLPHVEHAAPVARQIVDFLAGVA